MASERALRGEHHGRIAVLAPVRHRQRDQSAVVAPRDHHAVSHLRHCYAILLSQKHRQRCTQITKRNAQSFRLRLQSGTRLPDRLLQQRSRRQSRFGGLVAAFQAGQRRPTRRRRPKSCLRCRASAIRNRHGDRTSGQRQDLVGIFAVRLTGHRAGDAEGQPG